MESLKAAAALPKDHRPIERLGVMRQIEMYNFMRRTCVNVLASFECGGLSAKAHQRVAPSADRILPVGSGQEKLRIRTKSAPRNAFPTLRFGVWAVEICQ